METEWEIAKDDIVMRRDDLRKDIVLAICQLEDEFLRENVDLDKLESNIAEYELIKDQIKLLIERTHH